MRLLIISMVIVGASTQAQTLFSGSVYNDSNGNGKQDAGEPGVAGVVVSDQVNTVVTDAKGLYQFAALQGNGLVMISVPSGYACLPFWKAVSPGSQGVDFPLRKMNTLSEFSFVHASDTHVSERTGDRMTKFRNAVSKASPDLVLITGDLVRDALRVGEGEATRYYELFMTEIAPIKAPVWCAPGNHEIFGIERHLSLVSPNHPLYGRKMYQQFLGPDYYSFNYGGVHFIALNSLEYDDLYYYGRIDSVQLAWLKQDVAHVPAATPIVTFQHVPFFSAAVTMEPFEESGLGRTLERGKGGTQLRHVVSNSHDVFRIMQGHNFPLALAGHMHFQQKLSIEGVPTRFEQTAAIVGAVENETFRMPSGFTIYKVKDGKIDAGTFIRLDP